MSKLAILIVKIIGCKLLDQTDIKHYDRLMTIHPITETKSTYGESSNAEMHTGAGITTCMHPISQMWGNLV